MKTANELVAELQAKKKGKIEGIRSEKERLRTQAVEALRRGAKSSAARVGELRSQAAQQGAAHDEATLRGREDMRYQSARGSADVAGRGDRGNVGALQDAALGYGVQSAKYVADRESQKQNLLGSLAQQRHRAEMADAQYGADAAEREMSIGTADRDQLKLSAHYKSKLAEAEEDAPFFGEDAYMRKMISVMISEAEAAGADDQTIQELNNAWRRYR